MGQTADQLRQEIEHKREDAAAKIDQIEAKVQDIPNLARDTVRGQVDQSITQVRDSVDQSLNQARMTVTEKVGQMKEQTDVRGQIGQRPLAALGIAFAGGYLLGKVFGGDDKSSHGGYRYQSDWSQAHATSGSTQHASTMGISSGSGSSSQGQEGSGMSQGGGQPNAVVSALKQAAHEAGLDNTLSALSGALVATLTDQFNRTIRETFPEFAHHLEQQGGLGGSQSGGGSPSGGSGMSGSGRGGSSSGGSSTGGSGMGGSGSSGSGMGGSTSGGMGASGSMAGGTSTYGQSGTNADAASRTYGGSDTTLGATTDATGRPTPYFGNEPTTSQ